jgi:hypothetical protein
VQEADPNLIRSTLSDFHVIVTFSFCFVMAFFGQLAPIAKRENDFHFGEFLVAVCTSILSGIAAFFVLKGMDCPDVAIAGIVGLVSYFGTKSLVIMYGILSDIAKRFGDKV